jgi:hypothetical protein
MKNQRLQNEHKITPNDNRHEENEMIEDESKENEYEMCKSNENKYEVQHRNMLKKSLRRPIPIMYKNVTNKSMPEASNSSYDPLDGSSNSDAEQWSENDTEDEGTIEKEIDDRNKISGSDSEVAVNEEIDCNMLNARTDETQGLLNEHRISPNKEQRNENEIVEDEIHDDENDDEVLPDEMNGNKCESLRATSRDYAALGKKGGGKPRSRRQVTSKRTRFHCPVLMNGKQCTGYAQDIRRHIAHCHRELQSFEIRVLLLEFKQKRSRGKSTRQRHYVKKVCPLCKKPCSRLDNHLITIHKLNKGDEQYKNITDVAKADVVRTQQHKPNTLLEDVLAHFETHLVSRAGGGQSKKDAQCDKVRLKAILEEICIEQSATFNLQLLNYLPTIGDSDGVLERIKLKKEIKASTMVNYCQSALKFVAFVQEEDQYWIDLNVESKLRKAKQRIHKIIASYSKDRRVDEVRRNRELRKRVIPKDLIKKYLRSKTWTETQAKLKSISKGQKGTLTDLKIIRNNLLLRIFLLQAKRTGDLCSLTTQELQSVERMENGNNIIFVDNHKNRAFKTCRLSLKDQMLKNLKRYAKHVRPLVETKCHNVFTTMLGEQMTSRCMDEALETAWKNFEHECGEKLPKINPTIIRQSVASMVRQENFTEEQLSSVADHMCHNLKTAERYYDGTRGIRHTETASQLLCNMYDVSEVDSSDDGEDAQSYEGI